MACSRTVRALGSTGLRHWAGLVVDGRLDCPTRLLQRWEDCILALLLLADQSTTQWRLPGVGRVLGRL
jgi:hypothetical protein